MDMQWLESGEMPPEDLDSLSRNLAFHLKRLVDERDTQLEVLRYITLTLCVNIDLFSFVVKHNLFSLFSLFMVLGGVCYAQMSFVCCTVVLLTEFF